MTPEQNQTKMTAQAVGAPADGRLSVVGTPIGNLSDASPRVIDALSAADIVLCEDTRVTGKLLAAFGIRATLERADENVLTARISAALARIKAGERVAYVSDAGMPGVSDPGVRLVDAVLDAGLAVEVIPGPSAVTCALVASGLPMEHFFFEGFLPRKAGAQHRRLEELAFIPGALVVYESPRRVADTLKTIAEVFPTRRVALCRELTKLHEEVVRGLSTEVAAEVASRESVKGECVVVIEGPAPGESTLSPTSTDSSLTLDEAIRAGLDAGDPKSALAKRLSRERKLPRSEVYARILELSD